MHLVNLAPGISVCPDKVDGVVITRQATGFSGETRWMTHVTRNGASVVALTFRTLAEAEECVQDWTDKINGAEKSGTRVPLSEDLEARTCGTVNEIIHALRCSDASVESGIANMGPDEYRDLFVSLEFIIRKHVGGKE